MLFNVSIPHFVLFAVFLGIGILLIKYPEKVRKYDTRMTRRIKDDQAYIMMCRFIGVIFIIGSFVPLIFSLFPEAIQKFK